MAEITDTLVRVLGKKPKHTHVIIDELAPEDLGFGGMLTDECVQAKQLAPKETSG